MKLPLKPTDGFSRKCRVHEGDVAWKCECELRSAYFPPGLFSKMFVALHGLGTLRTYFASGGVLQAKDQSTTLLFVFDPTRFTLVLRVHGDKGRKSELREYLARAATAAESVFRQFKGLGGTVPNEYECSTAHEANIQVRAPFS